MLVTVALAVWGFIWAVRTYPIEVGGSILLFVGWRLFNAPNFRLKQAIIKASVDDALMRAYAALPTPPSS